MTILLLDDDDDDNHRNRKGDTMTNHDFFRNPLGNEMPAKIEIVIELERLISEHATESKLRGDYPHFVDMIENVFSFNSEDIIEILLNTSYPKIVYREIRKMLKSCLMRSECAEEWDMDYTVIDPDMCADILTKVSREIINFYLEPVRGIFRFSEREELIDEVDGTICDAVTTLVSMLRDPK
jgi:hypothetical protein